MLDCDVVMKVAAQIPANALRDFIVKSIKNSDASHEVYADIGTMLGSIGKDKDAIVEMLSKSDFTGTVADMLSEADLKDLLTYWTPAKKQAGGRKKSRRVRANKRAHTRKQRGGIRIIDLLIILAKLVGAGIISVPVGFVGYVIQSADRPPVSEYDLVIFIVITYLTILLASFKLLP